MKQVRVAVVQAGGVLFNREAGIQKLEHWHREAADSGARLILFPEAFIGGYPKGLDFGTRVGIRSDPGRDLFRRYAAGAIRVPSPDVSRIGGLCRELGTTLVVGVVEHAGGTLYCSALTFGPDGTLLGHRRKLMPTAHERVIWGCGDGASVHVTKTPHAVVSTAICWENYMPLLRTAFYGQGVEIYCAPTVDDRENWQATLRHISCEGRCFVLSACPFLRRADLEEWGPDGLPDPLIAGRSAIFGPMGRLLAGPAEPGECILTADLEPDELWRTRFDFDPVGHYARSDIFTLSVHGRGHSPVMFEPENED
ncbi:MAG: carbon-nitrogen hydrolase family protein [Myxococcota bacterium]